jgi:hypothetical protein
MADLADPIRRLQVLDALIASATERTDIDVIDAGLTPQFWAAMGSPPAPALAVHATARWERAQPSAPLVREPLVLRTTDITRIQGRVVTVDGTPVAGAEVRLSASTTAPARTGHDGHFTLPSAPAGAIDAPFGVLARGRLHTVAAQPPRAGQARSAGDILLIIDPIGVMT